MAEFWFKFLNLSSICGRGEMADTLFLGGGEFKLVNLSFNDRTNNLQADKGI